jgi:phenylalanyl-tRNA synthetase beta chain
MPPLELENPLSAEASVMRTSLVPGMLNMLAYNLNRGSDNVRLFEAGNVFQQAGTTAEQLKRICLGATGQTASANVHQPVRALSFFDLKGDIEDLLSEFGYQSLSFEMGAADYYHPGRSGRAVMDGTVVAEFGQIHPDVASARKLKQDVYVAELYLDRLYQHDLKQVRYQALSQYPAVERDFSFIFDDAVSFGKISAAVHELRLKELRQIAPVEIFRGGSVPAGKHSLLLRAKFQANERTLRDEDVAQWTGRIVKVLETLGGVQRA